FKRFREAFDRQRRQRWLAVAAGILLAVGVLGWALLHKRSENFVPQTAVLDLRDRSVARGTEANRKEPPLEISRTVSHVKVYLPFGSSDGYYGVRISSSQDKVLFSTYGFASTQQGITSLVVEVNLASANPGPYLLQIEK